MDNKEQEKNNNAPKDNGKKVLGKKEGVVVSDKREKTVIVSVSTLKTHPKYLKKYVSTKKYAVHDPEGKFHEGDKVTIVPCRPISKTKKYKVVYNRQ